MKQYEKEAVNDYLQNKEAGKQGFHFTGALQCFCSLMKKKGVSGKFSYVNDYKTDDPSEKKIAICDKYNGDQLKTKVLNILVTVVILTVNIVLREIIIRGIIWVGEETNSKQLSSITNGVFLA